MTYKIYYKDHQMFDIELYVAELGGKYNTEIKPYLIADGLGYYIIENIKEPKELEELLADVNEIDELRQTLYESYWVDDEWENRFLDDCKEASVRTYQKHKPKFEKIMVNFCNKYKLGLSTD